MLTRSQRVEIPEYDPEIERARHKNNNDTRKRRMVEANAGNRGNGGN